MESENTTMDGQRLIAGCLGTSTMNLCRTKDSSIPKLNEYCIHMPTSQSAMLCALKYIQAYQSGCHALHYILPVRLLAEECNGQMDKHNLVVYNCLVSFLVPRLSLMAVAEMVMLD